MKKCLIWLAATVLIGQLPTAIARQVFNSAVCKGDQRIVKALDEPFRSA